MLSVSDKHQEYVDVAWRYARNARCLPYGNGAYAVEFLTGFGAEARHTQKVVIIGDAHIFESAKFVGYHLLALYIALVFHQNFRSLYSFGTQVGGY